MEGVHISLKAEELTRLFGIPITNTLLMTFLVSAIVISIAFLVRRRLTLIPGRFQALFEFAIGGAYDYVADVLGDRKLAEKYFPLIATFFFFIFIGNLLYFIPGIASLGFFGTAEGHSVFTPLLRPIATDLNVTLALSIIAVIAIEIAGITVLGFLKYGGKFVNLRSPLKFAIGIIELFSEVARFISFSFRLFGNIFAGEVILVIVGAFIPVIIPVPLLAFELFVGIIQAAIFALLTLFFIKVAVTDEHAA